MMATPTSSTHEPKGDGEWMVTKVEMLHNQFKNMAMVASHFSSTFEIYNVFLVSKVEINNEWKKKIKIKNLKASRYLSVRL
jgi:hypothetical protein